MTILHVADFHYNKAWFDWLGHRAPPHDLLVMAGDLRDLAHPASQERQASWIAGWVAEYGAPICICSGNHDLEWDPVAETWQPAYWLRDLAGSRVWTDGQRACLGEFDVLNVACTSRPKGAEAEAWVVHAPPTGALVSRRISGRDGGDPELGARIARYAPRLVFCGHVHDPVHWRDECGPTLILNPGHAPGAAFPNHIVVRTESMDCRWRTAAGGTAAPAPTTTEELTVYDMRSAV